MKRKDKIYKATGLCLVLLLMLSTVPSGFGQGTQGSTTTQLEVEEDYDIGVEDYEIACTMDAKQCPDGSYVGRVPPNCEFAPCPGGGGVSFAVSTDKAEYTVGERVKISAKLIGTYREADVWAIVEYPNGEVGEIDFGEGLCAAAACMCVEGEVCNCPPPSCYYEGSMMASQAGAYYITAYAEGEDFEAKDWTKFLAYHGAEPEVEFSVRTDKAEYEVGEYAKIIASLSGSHSQVSDADVWATMEYPSGVAQRIRLEATMCSRAQGGFRSSCMYEGSVHVGQEGAHYITAYAEGEDFEAKDWTKFLAYSGSDPEVKFSVYTDQEEYRVGDRVRVTASLSGYQYQGIEDADVWANVEYPSGVSQRVRLEGTVCAASACDCPTEEVCECPPATVSCQFENKISVNQEGAHYITAYAEGDDFEKKAETKFWAYHGPDTKYVKLDQKFELDVEQSAVVTDYYEMRLTLDNIIYPKCAVLEEATAYDAADSAAVKCLDARGYAVLTVRLPLLAGIEIEDYEETQIRIQEGESASVYGSVISLLDLDDDEATLVVSKEGNGDFVDVKVEPSRQSVELGETAKYEIIVRDNHPAPLSGSEMPSRYYTYKIRVYDLPFSLEYDSWVEVGAGREATVPLYIYTSGQYVTGEAPSAVVASGAVQAQTVQVRAMNTVSAEAAMERVKVAPDIIASGRAYKFRVAVSGEDDSQDTAYAILNVLYSPPPPPPSDEVEIEMSQGWNLIALPGEGELSEGTCSGMDELYAFVYLKSEERYVTIREAARIMGERRLKEYLKTHSFWVYSYRNCAMVFRLEEATSFNDLSLEDGWNFVPITQDMEGNSLNDLGGDCDFEKTYYWNSKEQSWERLSLSQRFDDDMLYNGFVADVDDDCDFGWGAIITPPPLPA